MWPLLPAARYSYCCLCWLNRIVNCRSWSMVLKKFNSTSSFFLPHHYYHCRTLLNDPSDFTYSIHLHRPNSKLALCNSSSTRQRFGNWAEPISPNSHPVLRFKNRGRLVSSALDSQKSLNSTEGTKYPRWHDNPFGHFNLATHRNFWTFNRVLRFGHDLCFHTRVIIRRQSSGDGNIFFIYLRYTNLVSLYLFNHYI